MDPIELLENIANPKQTVENEARHKTLLADAAAVCEMLQTPGGKILRDKLQAMFEALVVPPERFTVIRVGAQGDTFTEVNATLVASMAGQRAGVYDVLAWLNSCEKMIEREAQKKTEAH